MSTPAPSTLRKQLYTMLVVSLIVAALVLALVDGVPSSLPPAALGSRVLLVVERAAGIFAVLFLLALVVVRAAQGQLPQELSGRGVKYASSDSVQELRDELVQQLDVLDERFTAVERSQLALSGAADAPTVPDPEDEGDDRGREG